MRGWLPHGVCLAILMVEGVLFLVNHRSEAQLVDVWRTGSTQDRLDALHVLANRGEPDPDRFGASFVAPLLSHPDTRLRDAAFSTDVCKFHVPELQGEWLLNSNVETPHWWISFVLHRRKAGGFEVGGGSSLTRRELAWYLDAEQGVVPPMNEVAEHLNAIRDRTRSREQQLGIVPLRQRFREQQSGTPARAPDAR